MFLDHSSNIQNILERFRFFWNILEHTVKFQKGLDVSGTFQQHPQHSRKVQIFLEHPRTYCKILERPQCCWNILEYSRFFYIIPESSRYLFLIKPIRKQYNDIIIVQQKVFLASLHVTPWQQSCDLGSQSHVTLILTNQNQAPHHLIFLSQSEVLFIKECFDHHSNHQK